MTRANTPRPAALLLLTLSACLAGGALAADLPKRKPGLWEINTRMEGMPSMGAMQQCIDQHTDNLMQQEAKNQKVDCSVMDVKTQGDRATVHSVCRMEGTTATTDALFVGAFESGYKGDIKVHYAPPLHGMSEMKMSQEAKWLGPCKSGQKPGDVIMPNMGKINVNEMMNDPQFKEMMKRQK